MRCSGGSGWQLVCGSVPAGVGVPFRTQCVVQLKGQEGTSWHGLARGWGGGGHARVCGAAPALGHVPVWPPTPAPLRIFALKVDSGPARVKQLVTGRSSRQ